MKKHIIQVDEQETFVAVMKSKAKEVGMTELARRCGIHREHLYKIFNSGNMELKTLYKVARNLGFSIHLGWEEK